MTAISLHRVQRSGRADRLAPLATLMGFVLPVRYALGGINVTVGDLALLLLLGATLAAVRVDRRWSSETVACCLARSTIAA